MDYPKALAFTVSLTQTDKRIGRTCCAGWGPLDLDLYLETRDDHAVSRDHGRIYSQSGTMRFARGLGAPDAKDAIMISASCEKMTRLIQSTRWHFFY